MHYCTRRQRRPTPLRRSTFGVPSASSDEGTDSDTDSHSVASSSSDSFTYASTSDVPKPLPLSISTGTLKLQPSVPHVSTNKLSASAPPRHTLHQPKSVSEQHNIEDMLASIRLRVTHHDVYEEWEQQTRKDAFVRTNTPFITIAAIHILAYTLRSLPAMNKLLLERTVDIVWHLHRRVSQVLNP